MKDFHEFLIFLTDYTAHYRELLDFETKKLDLITKDDVNELKNSLNIEQALIMKTNAFEQRRFEILKDEDNNKTFKEIIDEAPNEIKGQLLNNYSELSKLVFQIKKVNKNAQEIVTQRLRIIEEVKNGSVNTYTKGGTKKHQMGATVSLDKGI